MTTTYPIGEVRTEWHPIFEDALGWRYLDAEHVVVLYPMTFGKVRLCVGTEGGILDGFCYDLAHIGAALEGLETWTGKGDPPEGWHRNPFDGRRRENGDPATETVYS